MATSATGTSGTGDAEDLINDPPLHFRPVVEPLFYQAPPNHPSYDPHKGGIEDPNGYREGAENSLTGNFNPLAAILGGILYRAYGRIRGTGSFLRISRKVRLRAIFSNQRADRKFNFAFFHV